MTAETLRRSPLEHRAADLAAASGAAVTMAEVPFLTMLDLRVDPEGPAAARVAEVLGAPLPPPGRTAERAGDAAVLWLGPDEWLVVADDGAPDLTAALPEALAGERGSVVDVSAHRTTVALSGPAARDLLEHGCAIDLHDRAFPPTSVAQTLLARAGVIVWRPESGDYRLLVRSSFAGYLTDWLTDAATEYER